MRQQHPLRAARPRDVTAEDTMGRFFAGFPKSSLSAGMGRTERKSSSVETGWSWVTAWACCSINMMHFGVSRLSGLFLVEFIPTFGVSRGAAALPFSISSSVRNLSGPIVGILGQRFGIRPIASVGCVLASLGAGLCFFVSDVFWATIFWGVIFGFGIGMATSLLPFAVNLNFDKHRATALGISYSGSYIGSCIFPLFVVFLLDAYGISGTFLILSGLMLNSFPATLVMRTPPCSSDHSRVGSHSSLGSVISLAFQADILTGQNAEKKPTEEEKSHKSNAFNASVTPLTLEALRNANFISSNAVTFRKFVNLLPDREHLCTQQLSTKDITHQPLAKNSLDSENRQAGTDVQKGRMPTPGAIAKPKWPDEDTEECSIPIGSVLSLQTSLGSESALRTNSRVFPSRSISFEDYGDSINCRKPDNFSMICQSHKRLFPSTTLARSSDVDVCSGVYSIFSGNYDLNLTQKSNASEKRSNPAELRSYLRYTLSTETPISVNKFVLHDMNREVYQRSKGSETFNRTVIPAENDIIKQDLNRNADILIDFEEGQLHFNKLCLENYKKCSIASSITPNMHDSKDGRLRRKKRGHGKVLGCFVGCYGIVTDPLFLTISITMAMYSFVMVCIITVIQDFAKDIYQDHSVKPYFLMVLSLADLCGTLCLGWITDHGFVRDVHFIAICFMGMGVMTIAIAFNTNFEALLAIVAAYGIFESGVLITFPGLIARFIRSDRQAVAIASSNLFSAPTILLVPLVIGYFRDHLGSYYGLFCLMSLTSACCSVIWFLVPYVLRKCSR